MLKFGMETKDQPNAIPNRKVILGFAATFLAGGAVSIAHRVFGLELGPDAAMFLAGSIYGAMAYYVPEWSEEERERADAE